MDHIRGFLEARARDKLALLRMAKELAKWSMVIHQPVLP
jgi:hypothetical protein